MSMAVTDIFNYLNFIFLLLIFKFIDLYFNICSFCFDYLSSNYELLEFLLMLLFDCERLLEILYCEEFCEEYRLFKLFKIYF